MAKDKATSKYLSLILRHKPEAANITLDAEGYATVEEILKATNLNRDELNHIVDTNDKKRFAFSECGTKIRASQGHSIDVDLKLETAIPPDELYHGTKTSNLESIVRHGLEKMNRTHVHLSEELNTAASVASRRKGENVILVVKALHMRADGYKFYKSANGVWLTNNVPSKYIRAYQD